MLVPNRFNGYNSDGTRRLHKGGGGGSTYYANLDALYGEQTASARDLRNQSQKTFADMDSLRNEARGYGSIANQDRAAATATADFRAQSDNAMRGMADDLYSMGIDPSDERYLRQMRAGNIQGAAGAASAATGARDRTEGLGFARMQDITSMGLGLPGQATSAYNSAGTMASNAGQMRLNEAQGNQTSVAGAVRGGMDLYRFMEAADGGYVQKLAGGGIVGAMKGVQAPPPPVASAPVRSNTAVIGQAAAPGLMAKGMPQAMGKGIQAVGQAANSPGMVAFGNGMAVPKGADPAVAEFFTSPDTVAYQMKAANDVNAALGTVETTNAAAAGAGAAEGAGAVAAGTEAATAAAAAETAGAAAAGGGLGAAGAAVGAAMPWIGAAMLAGSVLGLFKDGGRVSPGASHRRGGEVDGPGGPKDDRVPALLSDGEFVLPVGTVKKYGLAKLEKMRQEGLQFEKQLGIGR